jgi:hypothetical protein
MKITLPDGSTFETFNRTTWVKNGQLVTYDLSGDDFIDALVQENRRLVEGWAESIIDYSTCLSESDCLSKEEAVAMVLENSLITISGDESDV